MSERLYAVIVISVNSSKIFLVEAFYGFFAYAKKVCYILFKGKAIDVATLK